jgi:hypothetical protein
MKRSKISLPGTEGQRSAGRRNLPRSSQEKRSAGEKGGESSGRTRKQKVREIRKELRDYVALIRTPCRNMSSAVDIVFDAITTDGPVLSLDGHTQTLRALGQQKLKRQALYRWMSLFYKDKFGKIRTKQARR